MLSFDWSVWEQYRLLIGPFNNGTIFSNIVIIIMISTRVVSGFEIRKLFFELLGVIIEPKASYILLHLRVR